MMPGHSFTHMLFPFYYEMIKSLMMTHAYSHTYIDLLSTRAKKHFSLHGEFCWRQTAATAGPRRAQTAGVQPCHSNANLPSLLLVHAGCCRNHCSHKDLIKQTPVKSFRTVRGVPLITEQWHGWVTVWRCVQSYLIQLPSWHGVTG